MKIEVPIPMVPRSTVGAISTRYIGWTQRPMPEKGEHLQITSDLSLLTEAFTKSLSLYFCHFHLHLFQLKVGQWWVIRIIRLCSLYPSAEKPSVQIYYWSTGSLSWNVTTETLAMKFHQFIIVYSPLTSQFSQTRSHQLWPRSGLRWWKWTRWWTKWGWDRFLIWCCCTAPARFGWQSPAHTGDQQHKVHVHHPESRSRTLLRSRFTCKCYFNDYLSYFGKVALLSNH